MYDRRICWRRQILAKTRNSPNSPNIIVRQNLLIYSIQVHIILLGVVVLFPGSKTSIPRISYPKAIDIWMFVCMIFVFGALIQYAFVNTMAQTEKKKLVKYQSDGGEVTSVIYMHVCTHSDNTNHGSTHCAKKSVTTMLTYPWKCTVLHCNHLGNIWKPLVLMT